MCTKREGEFAAVMQVVLDHMPDEPLTREFVFSQLGNVLAQRHNQRTNDHMREVMNLSPDRS
jgi:hypothetical protein